MNQGKPRHRNRRLFKLKAKSTKITLTDSLGFAQDVYMNNGEVLKLQEEMDDVVGRPNCRFNPCTHELLLADVTPVSVIENVFPGFGSATFTFEDGSGLVPVDPRPYFRELEIPGLGAWLDDFSAGAEDHFTHAFPKGFSLVNFIIELIQLFQGNIGKMANWHQRFVKAWNQFLRKIESNPSQYWLWFNFFLRPLLKDLENMLRLFERAAKRLVWLATHNHQLVHVKYRNGPFTSEGTFDVPFVWTGYDLNPNGDPPGSPGVPIWLASPDGTPSGGGGAGEGEGGGGPQQNVKLTMHYSLKVMANALGAVRFDIPDDLLDTIALFGVPGFSVKSNFWALASLTGINNPAAIIWEAIPFSWLVDWFTSRRDQLKLRLLEISPYPPAVVHRVGHSLRFEIESFLVYENTTTGVTQQVGTYAYRFYTRTDGYPDGDQSSLRVPQSWYNFSILAAIVTKGRKR